MVAFMPDQLYLSYWLRGFTGQNMLRHYEKMLRLFPYSRLAKNGSVFRVVPIDNQQPAVFERAFPNPLDPAEALAAARDFHHADSAYRLESWWDLWQYDGEWQLLPARVALCCQGPEFENGEEEHLRIEFGVDSQFLPQPGIAGEAVMIQSNIKSLLKLVHDLDDGLAAERRSLWTESGENFSEKLRQVLSGAG
jgi:hypothetical protein